MTTMWEPGEVAIERLMRDINKSALALPQFQRQSVWTGANWIPFLLAVLKGRPTGTLLLLSCKEGHEDFAPRNIETAPQLDPKKSVASLLLDGQQRLTTLYRCFFSSFKKGRSNNHYDYVIKVKEALERQELLEEDFTLTKRGNVGGFAELAEKGLVTFQILYTAADFENWKTAYTGHHLTPKGKNAGDLVQAFEDVMGGATSLASYKFPVLKIDQETPLDVVVDIFEGMNRRGQKLNQFDLMVARLYKPLGDETHYNLRNRWEEELANSPILKSLGITEDDGMLPLQLIAKQISREDDDVRKGVKGLTNKDVLELEAQQVIGGDNTPLPDLSLARAVQALESAAEFLHRVCGIRSALLPQKSMLLPIADQYLRPENTRLNEGKLKKWFFCVGLRGHYHGSVNSYANTDCNELEKWAEDQVVPATISGFSKGSVNGLDLLQSNTREAAIIGNSIMALLIATGALDWHEDALAVKDCLDDVELHHVVPARRLKSILSEGDSTKPIAGLTPITKSSNLRISDTEPGTVIQDLDKQATQIMRSHKIDEQLLSDGFRDKRHYEAFLKDRQKKLKAMIVQALGL